MEYIAYSLNTSTGQEVYTADLAREYCDMSYPEFLHCSATYLRDHFQDEIPDDHPNPDLYTVLGMDAYTLFVGEGGQIMLCGDIFLFKNEESNGICIPFDPTAMDPPSAQREKDAYHWLFNLRTDGGVTEAYATLLANAFLSDPEAFVNYVAEEDSAQLEEIAKLTAFDLQFDTANTSKAICLQLYNSGTLTDAETDVVKQMLEQISPSDYGNIVYKEKLITELKGRTLIPASEYSYKITCMEVYDPVGYAGQYWFGSISTESRGSGGYSDVYLEIYNPYYTDAQCPESNHDVSCQYDEAFYKIIFCWFLMCTRKKVSSLM